MSYLGATLTQVFTRARVTQRCHNSPDGKRGYSVPVIWWILKNLLVESSSASEEDSWLSLARGGLGQVSHVFVGVGRWKSQNRKNVYLSPYVEEPLNSKVIKMFRTWTKKSWVFFVFRDSYIVCIYVMNIICTFRISVSWVWYTWCTFLKFKY